MSAKIFFFLVYSKKKIYSLLKRPGTPYGEKTQFFSDIQNLPQASILVCPSCILVSKVWLVFKDFKFEKKKLKIFAITGCTKNYVKYTK